MPVSVPETPVLLERVQNTVYSKFGVKIYDEGFGLDGSGANTLYQFTSPDTFWHNVNNSLSEGVMNRVSIWSIPATDGQQIGFSQCIDVPEEKTYLVGIGVDNYIDIKVDGVSIVAMPDDTNDTWTFNYWHVYPVTLKAGLRVIEVIGTNQSSVAAVGVEIYDCTPAQLMATTTIEQLTPYLIFSTQDLIDTDTYLGTNGYPVIEGWSLVSCENPMYYRKVEQTPCL